MVVDPNWETADVDVDNNHFPRRIVPSRIEAFKAPDSASRIARDLIQDSTVELDGDDEEAADDAGEG